MSKIVFFETERWEEDYIKNNFNHEDIILTEEKLTQESASKYKDLEIASTFIYSALTREVLQQLPSLKYIATRSTGIDHIDIEFCKEKGILVSNVPSYGAHTVAEHVFALILAISRKLIPSLEKAKKGDFSNIGLEGFDLNGKTLGVVGVGHIGKNVVAIARAFGMKVLIYSRHVDEDLAKDEGVKFVDLNTLMSSSDIITLHAPHTKETEHMINLGNLNGIKKEAVLINTARGALVETQAIVEGLEKGIFKAVGLDVLEEEGYIREEKELLSTEFLNKIDVKTGLLNHVLLTRDDVIITPHNAFNSREAVREILEVSLSNIKSYINSSPINTIE